MCLAEASLSFTCIQLFEFDGIAVHGPTMSAAVFSGGNGGGVTPVPVPNTVVKASSADGTALEREWESRSSPEISSKPRCEGIGASSISAPNSLSTDGGVFG